MLTRVEKVLNRSFFLHQNIALKQRMKSWRSPLSLPCSCDRGASSVVMVTPQSKGVFLDRKELEIAILENGALENSRKKHRLMLEEMLLKISSPLFLDRNFRGQRQENSPPC